MHNTIHVRSKFVQTQWHCNTLQHAATHCVNSCQNTHVDDTTHVRSKFVQTQRHCNTLQHITLQHIATHCNTLHHAATHCCTLHHWWRKASMRPWVMRNDTLQHTATHCNTLQHTATHCSTLQHWRHTATHFDWRKPLLRGGSPKYWNLAVEWSCTPFFDHLVQIFKKWGARIHLHSRTAAFWRPLPQGKPQGGFPMVNFKHTSTHYSTLQN